MNDHDETETTTEETAPTITRRADIGAPYFVTDIAPTSADCDYCDEGDDYDRPHSHAFYVSRDGAASRTADNLCAVFLTDVADLTTYVVPADLTEIVDAVESAEWLDNPDHAQWLNDECNGAAESALGDAGFYVDWSDGYRIAEYREATAEEISARAEEIGTELGHSAGTWSVDGNTTDETKRALIRAIDACEWDGPAAPTTADALTDVDRETRVLLAWILANDDDGAAAYFDAFNSAAETETYRAAVATLSADATDDEITYGADDDDRDLYRRMFRGATVSRDDDGATIVDRANCGECGRTWNDALVSSVTPAPSARCPFEYDHDDHDDHDETTDDDDETNARIVWSAERGWHDGARVKLTTDDRGRLTADAATCDRCGRRIVRGLTPLAGTRASRAGEVVTLDGRTCRVCLAADGWEPVRD